MNGQQHGRIDLEPLLGIFGDIGRRAHGQDLVGSSQDQPADFPARIGGGSVDQLLVKATCNSDDHDDIG